MNDLLSGRTIQSWIFMILILLAVNGLFSLRLPTPAAEVPYSTFLVYLRAGDVTAVEMTGQQVRASLKSAISWAPQKDAALSTYEAIVTQLPPLDDARLLPLLEEKSVTITARPPGSPWPAFLLVGVLAGGALLYVSRRGLKHAQLGILGQSPGHASVLTRPAVTFANVAGEEQAKQELAEVVDFLRHPEKYRMLGGRIPRGVLLVGPPGTGKTLLARAVAGEARVPFFSISGSEFVQIYVGMGASRVREFFQKARQTVPSIVFMDELDAVGRQRGTLMGNSNEEREQTLNQLLVEMDGFDADADVIVIAATNRPDVLDPALLRPGRFDRQVVVGLPDREGREAILRVHSRAMPLAPDVNLGILARSSPGFSGADLANLCNEAALLAARHSRRQVEMADFQEALDKIMLGAERPLLISEQERHTVAYHEAGHALLACLLPGADPVHRVSIIPRGRTLGVTAQLPEEEHYNHSRDDLRTRLVVLMGGRSAEEVALGQMTTGAENDLQQATRLVQGMILRWGMSETVGPVSYEVGETNPYLGRETNMGRAYSETTASLIDQEVRRTVEEACQRALDLLTSNRATLDALAAALLEAESLDAAAIAVVLAATDPQSPMDIVGLPSHSAFVAGPVSEPVGRSE
jgi:cell division protease FtsH